VQSPSSTKKTDCKHQNSLSKSIMFKIGLMDDEPQGSMEASLTSSPRSTIQSIMPESTIEGKSKESSADELAPDNSTSGVDDDTILQAEERIAGLENVETTNASLPPDSCNWTCDVPILNFLERVTGRKKTIQMEKAVPADYYESTSSGGHETVLQEHQRVQSKKAMSADDHKSINGAGETIIEEFERISVREIVQTKKALPVDDSKSASGGDETILQEFVKSNSLPTKKSILTQLGLKHDKPQVSREESSSSSPRPTVKVIVPDIIEGREKSKEPSADELALEKSTSGRGDDTILEETGSIAGRMKLQTEKVVPVDYYEPASLCDESILQETKRIAGGMTVRTKKAVSADDHKSTSNGAGETIMQEKERIAGRRTRRTKKAGSSIEGDETILQEKERIAGRGKKKKASTILHLDSNQTSPGAFRIGGKDNDDESSFMNGEKVKQQETPVYEVNARLVEENEDPENPEHYIFERIPEAEFAVAVATEDEGRKRKRLLYIAIGISVISVIVGTILGMTLSTGSTSSPLAGTTPLQRDAMISLIQLRSSSTNFSDSSPQSQALDWILSDLFSSSDGLSEDRLVQRFALATLYYSTNGTNWDHVGWLNSTNECLWDRNDIVCSPEPPEVEGLDLSEDSLSGRIPIELSLLTQLTSLRLYKNQLAGSLPSEFGLLTQLTQLDLYENQLTGPLPSELGVLAQLTSPLALYRNKLSGSVPTSLCSSGVQIDCGEITCTCCISGDTFQNCTEEDKATGPSFGGFG
jgi:hypothetical protein